MIARPTVLHALGIALMLASCGREAHNRTTSMQRCREEYAGRGTADGDRAARVALAQYGFRGTAVRYLVSAGMPSRTVGTLPTNHRVFVLLVDHPSELQVAENVEGQFAEIAGIDLPAGDSLLALIRVGPESLIGDVDVAIRGEANLQLVFGVKLSKELGRLFPVRGGLPLRYANRCFAFRRCGLGLSVIYDTLPAAQLVAPVWPQEEKTWQVAFRATGGGLSPLDANESDASFAEASRDKDCLALRRYLRKRIDERRLGRAEDIVSLISAEDPFTAYWAAKLLATAGELEALKQIVSSLRYANGLDDYVVSAVYQAVADTDSDGSRGFLLDAHMFRSSVDFDENGDRTRWLAPMLASLLTDEERDKLLAGLGNGALSRDELLYAADVLLCGGEKRSLDPIFARIQAEKGGGLRGELLARVRTMVRPPQLLSKAGPERVSFYSRWSDDDEFVIGWWQMFGGSLRWDAAWRAFVVRAR